jgi:alkylhydroperoxidase family enzyme
MYDRIFGEGRDPVAEPGTADGTTGDWWTVFALVPDVLQHAVRGFVLYQSDARVLDPVLRELGQTRAGWLVGSAFVHRQHCRACRALGIADDKVDAIASWRDSPLFDRRERAVLAYVDELVAGGAVGDATFAALRDDAGLADEAILELTYITAMYAMHAAISRALELEGDHA